MVDQMVDRQQGQLCTGLLANSAIAFFGVGRSVTKIEFLASAGVGKFMLVDAGIVEPENIGQSAFVCDEVGQPKVSAASVRIGRINLGAEVVCFERRDSDISNLADLLKNIDLIIDGTDSLTAAMRISRIALDVGTDALHIRTEGNNRQYAIVGTLPREARGRGCLRCLLKGACDAHEEGYEPPPYFSSHRVVPETLNVKAAWVALGLLHHRAASNLPIASIGECFARLPCWIGLNGVDPSSGQIFPIRAYREPLPSNWQCPVCGTTDHSSVELGRARETSGAALRHSKEEKREGDANDTTSRD
jgi:molybdopterin/thiamine biosynthesis adenylyltransferase